MSPSSAQSTVPYQPPPASPPTPGSAPPVVLVRDAAPDDPTLLRFVRTRARLGGTIMLVVWLLFLVREITTAADQYATHRILIFGIAVAIQVVITALVWGRRELTVRQYNRLWLTAYTTQAALLAGIQLDTFSRPEQMSRLFADGYRSVIGVQYASGWGAMWFSLILCDAALYPRTARWTLKFGLVCAAISVGVCLVAYSINDALTAADLRPLIGQIVIWVTLGTVFGMMAQYRLETLRQQAEQARRFGQYRLSRKLDRGGMGEVYLAEHLLLKRPSVIKMVRADRAAEPALLARFEREVKMLATLTHANTVQVFDYGHTADGTFYYVMEFLPGLDLNRLVAAHGPLSPGRVVYLLRQVCRALREAHAAGLIHRDVKPSNVMVCERGGIPDVAKLLDFGLVHANRGEEADQRRLTTIHGAIMGTAEYMSSEQAAGLPTDHRSDIYSLGATAYFLLTGRPVFERPTIMLTLSAHISDPPPLPGSDVPPDLAEVLRRCLSKNPGDRFADVLQVEAAMAVCACAGEWNEEHAAGWWAKHRPDQSTTPTPPLAPTATL